MHVILFHLEINWLEICLLSCFAREVLLRIVSKENNEIISFVVELVLIFFVKVISFSKVDTICSSLDKQEIDSAKKTSEGGRS